MSICVNLPQLIDWI